MYLLKNITTVEMGILYCLFRISFEYRISNTDCEFQDEWEEEERLKVHIWN